MQVHIHGLVIMMSLSSGIQHQQSNLTILLKKRNKGSFKVHDVTFILKNYKFNWKHFQSSRNKPDEETLLLFWQQLCEIPSVIYRWSHKIRKQPIEDKSQYGPPITGEIQLIQHPFRKKVMQCFYVIAKQATITHKVVIWEDREGGQTSEERVLNCSENKFDSRLISPILPYQGQCSSELTPNPTGGDELCNNYVTVASQAVKKVSWATI